MRTLNKRAKLRSSVHVLDENHWNEMVAGVMRNFDEQRTSLDWKAQRAHQYRTAACRRPSNSELKKRGGADNTAQSPSQNHEPTSHGEPS